MSFLTIFTSPKPFIDPHIVTIQRNAIRSWTELGDQVEVILMGDEVGMAELSSELKIKHLSDIACNNDGTPMISDMFLQANQISKSPMLAYINADMIMLEDVLETSKKILKMYDKFLLVGRRWNLDITEEINFTEGWQNRLQNQVKENGIIQRPTGSDYFIYPRTVLKTTPKFVVGRAGWDNWMIYHGVTQPWPIIETTETIMGVHQNHDYSHLPEGQRHYKLPESFENIRLAGGHKHIYTLHEVNKMYSSGKIKRKKFTLRRFLRLLELWITPLELVQEGYRWALILKIRKLQRTLN
jgi:hypothetical protein